MKTSQKYRISIIVLLIFLGCRPFSQSNTTTPADNQNGVTFWLTSPVNHILFQKQSSVLSFNSSVAQVQTINVADSIVYQTMDGFGCSLTGGSAMLIHKMETGARSALLKELFAVDGNSIGISYLRISIGSSDLDEKVFSYDDLPAGETDENMVKFDLGYDKLHLIPVLKEILAINPNIKILGSPWSAPTWMKDNNESKGGSLLRKYFAAYATYFVKYIQGMKSEGIRIDAITVQNEPLNPDNNPSMYMTAQDQAEFIRENLGPAFTDAGIDTKIIVYDHNADTTEYPLTIYKDANASKYVDGAAFHLYRGTIDALTPVHHAYPGKNLYFTEQWVGAPGNLSGDLVWHIKNLIIGASRNWCKNVLEWNLAADPEYNPHTTGGCDNCLGAVTISGNVVLRNPAYYIMAHAAKFVRPGAVRIYSSLPANLPNVAFKINDGHMVLIVLNDDVKAQNFNIHYRDSTVNASLEKGAVATYIW